MREADVLAAVDSLEGEQHRHQQQPQSKEGVGSKDLSFPQVLLDLRGLIRSVRALVYVGKHEVKPTEDQVHWRKTMCRFN